MITTPQLPSVYHNPSCDWWASYAEENRMQKVWLTYRSQGKTERSRIICTFR